MCRSNMWTPAACKDPMSAILFPRRWNRGNEPPASPKTDEDAFRIGGGVYHHFPQAAGLFWCSSIWAATHLAEVSWINWDDTPSPRPPHYIFHVAETKPTFIPEQSKNIKQVAKAGATPKPDAPWRPTDYPDELAVMASSATGVDMCRDPNLRDRVFFTDRLRQAIEASRFERRAFHAARGSGHNLSASGHSRATIGGFFCALAQDDLDPVRQEPRKGPLIQIARRGQPVGLLKGRNRRSRLRIEPPVGHAGARAISRRSIKSRVITGRLRADSAASSWAVLTSGKGSGSPRRTAMRLRASRAWLPSG